MTRILIVVSYVFLCARIGAKPWRYFQFNAKYFNEQKGIFSKLDIDRLIPAKWRLEQYRDDGKRQPESFPIFIKPEWGQNGYGISCAHNASELQTIRDQLALYQLPAIIQTGAEGLEEYEIFVMPDWQDRSRYSLMSVARVRNISGSDYPINSIYNNETQYEEISQTLTQDQRDCLWDMMKEIETFNIARIGIRAHSLEEVLKGQFSIIEINLFVPFPMILACKKTSFAQRMRFLFRMTHAMAHITKGLPFNPDPKSVFFRKWKLSRQLKIREKRT